jgi:hypothetical protein
MGHIDINIRNVDKDAWNKLKASGIDRQVFIRQAILDAARNPAQALQTKSQEKPLG